MTPGPDRQEHFRVAHLEAASWAQTRQRTAIKDWTLNGWVTSWDVGVAFSQRAHHLLSETEPLFDEAYLSDCGCSVNQPKWSVAVNVAGSEGLAATSALVKTAKRKEGLEYSQITRTWSSNWMYNTFDVNVQDLTDHSRKACLAFD